jgi:hypothetical protein
MAAARRITHWAARSTWPATGGCWRQAQKTGNRVSCDAMLDVPTVSASTNGSPQPVERLVASPAPAITTEPVPTATRSREKSAMVRRGTTPGSPRVSSRQVT